jgi:hypothetical protein
MSGRSQIASACGRAVLDAVYDDLGYSCATRACRIVDRDGAGGFFAIMWAGLRIDTHIKPRAQCLIGRQRGPGRARLRSWMTTGLTDDPKRWRDRARAARIRAGDLNDPEAKRQMLGIARGYDRLAERADERLRMTAPPAECHRGHIVSKL